MTRKTRRILLGLAILAFLVVGFVMTMYARGYRWDFDKNRFLLSGAVYLKSLYPDDTQIFINGKNTEKTAAALIKNLLPARRYKTQVLKEGYQSWEKEFEITPGLVANAENIILFPKKLNSQIIWPEGEGLVDFSVSPNQKFIAGKINSSKIIIRDLEQLDATARPLNLNDKRKTTGVAFLKNNKGWSANSQKFLFSRDTTTRKLWYIWDSDTLIDLTALYERKIVLKQPSASPLPTKFAPTKISWLGNSSLLAILNGRLFQLDIQNETVTDLKLSDVVDFDAFENKIIALKNPDILLLMDSAVENISVLGQAQFAPQRILISPDGSKVSYFDANSLGVFWLKDTPRQPLKKANDQEVVYESTGHMTEIYWQNENEHLLILDNQKLYAVEIDTRDKINIAAWPETIAAINYLSQDSKLFILENSAIKSLDGKF